jgi:hypothetical protein
MKAGHIDCIALSRESLSGLAPKIPGSRILDGGFLNSSTAVAVPKGKPKRSFMSASLSRKRSRADWYEELSTQ